MIDFRSHWDEAYRSKDELERSWSQSRPEHSLQLIETAKPNRSASIIDVGGGASRLVDCLLADGYRDLWVLDISSNALDQTKIRLGALASRISWIVEDITKWRPPRTWDVWHDRAVFHFLVDPYAQDAYLSALRSGTATGSIVIIAAFALTGPERCSGLPVQRYSHHMLAGRLGSSFRMFAEAKETHVTPFGTGQDFIYGVFERN